MTVSRNITFDFSANEKLIDNQKLLQFLQALELANVDYLAPGEYTLNNQAYTLKQGLLRRNRIIENLPRHQVKFDVLSADPLADGSYGQLFDVIKSITPGKHSARIKDDKKHVVKMTCETSSNRQNIQFKNTSLYDFETEIKMLQKDGRFHPKNFRQIKEDDIVARFVTMRKFPGVTLKSLIDSNTMTVEERLRLTIALPRALKEQVHQLGIIHRDIKPENILVDMTTMEINIIDFGLSIDKDQKKSSIGCGTPLYSSPETFTDPRNITQKSDIFSMGRTLAVLWDDQGDIWKVDTTRELIIQTLYQQFDRDRLFKNNEKGGIYSNLNTEAKDIIKLCIANMNSRRPDHRNSLDTLITHFHTAYLTQCHQNINDEQTTILSDSFKKGLDARKKIILLHSKESETFFDTLTENLHQIDPHEESIREFTHGLGWHSLQQAASQDDVLAMAQNIIRNLADELKKYHGLFKYVELLKNKYEIIFNTEIFSEFREFMLELKHKLDRIKPLDLDLLKKTSESLHACYDSWVDRLDDVGKCISNNPDFQDIAATVEQVSVIKKPVAQLSDTLPTSQRQKELQLIFTNLKDALRKAIRKYMKITLTDTNIHNRERAASERRKKDIEDFIFIIDTSENTRSLRQQTENRMKNIETGFFGRSILRDNLNKAMEEHDNYPDRPIKGKGVKC